MKENPYYDIPRLGIKSSIIIMLFALLSNIVIPSIFYTIGIDFKITILICNALIMPFSICYARYFIETKRGYCKKFLRTYIIFSISFAVLSFFWLYLEVFI